jgi:hypothetical protein
MAMSEAAMDWSRLAGALLFIRPHGPASGEPPTIQADVTVLDGGDVGSVYAGVRIVSRTLRRQVESVVGSQVLGRLGQGQAKPGQSKPRMLLPATEEDKLAGFRHLRG